MVMELMWLQFILSSLAVVGAGIYVGQFAGEIGDRLKLGRAWAGAVILSLATTTPELVSTVTVVLRGEPGLAFGCILGSVIFSLFLLALVDAFDPDPIYKRLSSRHLATGVLNCLLLGIIVTGMALAYGRVGGPKGLGFGHVGITSIILLIFFAVGQYVLFQTSRANQKEQTEETVPGALSQLSPPALGGIFAGLIAVIAVAAYNLGVSADKIAGKYGWGATFAGAVLLGIVTSLPEITNAVACSRKKDFDLAAGNLLGVNGLLLCVLALSDFLFVKGRLFNTLGRSDTVSSIAMAGIAIVMNGAVLMALITREKNKIWRWGITSVLLAGLYILSLLITYQFSRPVLILN